MKIKNVLISVITCVGLLASSAMPVFAGSPDYIAGKDLSWNVVDGKSYWYEGGYKQGTNSDKKCFSYAGTLRGREIYDKESNAWYWLDVIYDGAKAIGKEVFMPYIYQGETGYSDAMARDMANLCDEGMKDFIYDGIIKRTGKWVRYDENGKMIKGWVTIQGELANHYPTQKGNTYYYDTKTGAMAKGWITLSDGVSYHFDEKTGKLLESKTADKKEDLATIYYNGPGAQGYVYAIEADIDLMGAGTGNQALLTIGNANDSIKFGLTYEAESSNASAKGNCALTSESYKAGKMDGSRKYHDIYYPGSNAKCNLMMIVDGKSGTAWLFHNHKYLTHVENEALIGDPLYIRAEGKAFGTGLFSASFKNVKVKNPVNGEEVITTKGNPEIGKQNAAGITYAPVVNDASNGYAYCIVTATSETATPSADAYGYLEFVNGSTIK